MPQRYFALGRSYRSPGPSWEQFAAMPWQVPNAVQLFLMDQEQQYFRVWMLRDGRLQEYLPAEPDENTDDFLPH